MRLTEESLCRLSHSEHHSVFADERVPSNDREGTRKNGSCLTAINPRGNIDDKISMLDFGGEMSINAEFRARRDQCGATQQEVALRAGVTVQTIKLWERGLYPLPGYGLDALESFEDDLDAWRSYAQDMRIGCRARTQKTVRIPYFRSQDDLDFYLSTLTDSPELRLVLRGLDNSDALRSDDGYVVSVSRMNAILLAVADELARREVAVERYFVDELCDSGRLHAAQPLFSEQQDPATNPEFFAPELGVHCR